MGSDELGAEVARARAICEGAAVAPIAPPRAPLLLALTERFGLSAIELDVVRILLAVELDDALAGHAAWRGGRPSIGALHRLLGAIGHDDDAALAPAGHLARAGLIEVAGDGPYPRSQVRLPACFWPRLAGWAAPLPFAAVPVGAVPVDALVIAAEVRAQIAAVLRHDRHALGLIAVAGAAEHGRELVAVAIAGALGLPALVVAAALLESPDRLAELAREAIWLGAAIVVDGALAVPALARLLRQVPAHVIVSAEVAPVAEAAPDRWRADVALAALSADEAAALWHHQLGADDPALDLQTVARQLGHAAGRIASVAALARQRAAGEARPIGRADLRWAARLGQASTSGLAQRLDTALALDDVVVPATTRRELELARSWARHGTRAFASPAAGRHLRGHAGLVCLFHGPPGTGKTMAARALCGELELELLRIDLSQVVNKYIGETEKNLARVFDEADATGAALLFDEADALFGKRSEVKDAHDRYANLETAFLLQRLEAHPGLCILASNLRQHLDDAFFRRIQIVAEFPVPGPDERLEIWQRHLSARELAADVELAQVARQFALAGGDIRNAAASALLMATADARPLAMAHLAIGIWRELRKSGRLVTADDFGPWRDVVLGYAR